MYISGKSGYLHAANENLHYIYIYMHEERTKEDIMNNFSINTQPLSECEACVEMNDEGHA